VVCADGAKLGYDALALCTGTRARRLGVPVVDLLGALYLRTLADADRIKSAVLPGSKAVIIGGG
jgi:3-phenylpropionate/trans-cinnamate dioxygenase ferredoxin reductase subunit